MTKNVRNLETIVGRVPVQADTPVLTYFALAGILIAKRGSDIVAGTQDKSGDNLVVRLDALSGIEQTLGSGWDVRQPPALVRQMLTSYIVVDNYGEAFAALQQEKKEEFDAAQALLQWLGKRVHAWNIAEEAAAGKLDQKMLDRALNNAYLDLWKKAGAARKVKDDTRALIRGQRASDETLTFLAGHVDPRFAGLQESNRRKRREATDDYQYAQFAQQAVARALLSIDGSDAEIAYKDGQLREASIAGLVNRYFLRLNGNIGVATVITQDTRKELAEAAPVPLSALQELPEEVRARYRPLPEVVADIIILRRIAEQAIIAYVKQLYGGKHAKESGIIAAEVMQRFAGPDTNRAYSQLSNEVFAAVEANKVAAATPFEQSPDVRIVLSAALVMRRHLPYEVWQAVDLREQRASSVKRAGRQREQERLAALRQLDMTLQQDFGTPLAMIPAYDRKFSGQRILDTLQTYFG